MKRLPRRAFLQLTAAAGGSLVAGFDPRSRSWVTDTRAAQRPLEKVPKLDGELHLDEMSRKVAASDWGLIVHHQPIAVLKPGSVQDVVTIVRYANQHRIKIAMRGRGHSVYGQAQVEAGIVIDSSTLKAAKITSAGTVDVQPGISWGDLNNITFAKGLTPPVINGCVVLTVGGTLSIGGMGHTSHRFGAQVDNVEELDVVTGDGRLVTCSSRREKELFDVVLAGIGQCAIVVRARLHVVPAQTDVLLQDLVYDDLGPFLSDIKRLTLEGRFDHVWPRIQKVDGTWKFFIVIGKFFTPPNNPELAALVADLKFKSKSDTLRSSYRDYLHTTRTATKEAAGAPFRSGVTVHEIAMWLPDSAAADFIATILATPSDLAKASQGLDVWPMITTRFTRPLFKMPGEDFAYGIWIYDGTNPNESAGVSAMLARHRSLYERMRSAGGKRYGGFGAVPFSPTDWQDHFGLRMWNRLVAAKKKYDPNSVLTPGPGMFSH